MILLAIDTSTRYAGVALARDGDIRAEATWRSEQNHTVELMPYISALLKLNGLSVADVTHLGVAVGPGSFSALRVGLGTAKGLALPRRLPLAGISTWDIEAWPYMALPGGVVAVIPGGRAGVAWARYAPGPARQRLSEGFSRPECLIAATPPDALFCGEGAPTLALAGTGRVLGTPGPTRRPSVLAALAWDRLARGDSDDAASLTPTYARPPSITRPGPAPR